MQAEPADGSRVTPLCLVSGFPGSGKITLPTEVVETDHVPVSPVEGVVVEASGMAVIVQGGAEGEMRVRLAAGMTHGGAR